jgi:hypothetical protein
MPFFYADLDDAATSMACGSEDVVSHTVWAVMTAEFLDFSRSRGNDLSTPVMNLAFILAPPPARLLCGWPCASGQGKRFQNATDLLSFIQHRAAPINPSCLGVRERILSARADQFRLV